MWTGFSPAQPDKPRILCFLHSFEPGGVERTALHLCDAWRRGGAEVAVMLGRREGRMQADAPALDYRTPPAPPFSTGPFETLWMLFWLPRLIRRFRPDLLFCAGNSYTIVAVAMKLLFGRRCPPIVAKISNDLLRADLPRAVRPLYHLWCRIQGRMLDELVALSPEMRDEIISVMRCDPERVTVIEDAVLGPRQMRAIAAAGRIARATRGPGRRFVAIGRLARQKDFPLLLRAFSAGALPDDRLAIVGEGAERPRLERMIRQLGLAERVELPGHVERVEQWLKQADALLLSSHYEGLPAVVIEALAAGLPVIATDCCASMATMLGDGAFGTLVQPGDESAFAAAIGALVPERQDADAAMAFAARFTVEAAVERYTRLFAQTVRRPVIMFPHPAPAAEQARQAA